MLGADVVVSQRARLLHRELEHPLGARRERDLADGHGAAGRAHHVLDLLADAVEVQTEVVEHRGRDPLAFPDHAEQQVLGANVVVLQSRRLFPREVNDFTDPLRELVMHSVWCGAKGSDHDPEALRLLSPYELTPLNSA